MFISHPNKLLITAVVKVDESKCYIMDNQKEKDVHILSFDGGGTRGVMEVFILNDIMKTATILRDDPGRIQEIILDSNGDFILADKEIKSMKEVVESVLNPIHPTGRKHTDKIDY